MGNKRKEKIQFKREKIKYFQMDIARLEQIGV